MPARRHCVGGRCVPSPATGRQLAVQPLASHPYPPARCSRQALAGGSHQAGQRVCGALVGTGRPGVCATGSPWRCAIATVLDQNGLADVRTAGPQMVRSRPTTAWPSTEIGMPGGRHRAPGEQPAVLTGLPVAGVRAHPGPGLSVVDCGVAEPVAPRAAAGAQIAARHARWSRHDGDVARPGPRRHPRRHGDRRFAARAIACAGVGVGSLRARRWCCRAWVAPQLRELLHARQPCRPDLQHLAQGAECATRTQPVGWCAMPPSAGRARPCARPAGGRQQAGGPPWHWHMPLRR